MAIRKASPKLLRSEIVQRLEDLPRQILALESAMEEFPPDFDRGAFKRAFEMKAGIKGYNKVQAVERAFSRVQSYLAELAEGGARLAGLELPNSHEGDAARSFDALRDEGVIGASLAKDLKRVQKARSAVEHEYLGMRAGRLHEATALTVTAAGEFLGPFSRWIAPYLE